jgi:DNA-binding PadR family transcriptional regulator
MSKVKSRVPRGFTRYYILHLLSEKPMTGKEIIDKADSSSEGAWKPSPGLIYPLLGRLARDSLVEEVENGRFAITPKGERALDTHVEVAEQIERQLRLMSKLGLSVVSTGKFVAEEAFERILSVTSAVKEKIAEDSLDLQRNFNQKYKAFLEKELERMEREKRYEEERARDGGGSGLFF